MKQFDLDEEVWVVPPTEYKIIKSLIKRIYIKSYLIRNYKYHLAPCCIFKTKNEAIDCLIARLNVLRDRSYKVNEVGEKRHGKNKKHEKELYSLFMAS
jgi:hypothetical protein